jgi:septal ring factor EnvC (AmiA/AmiB activator)
MMVEENELLAMKVNIKKRQSSTQTEIEFEEMEHITNHFEEIRKRAIDLEDENERLEKEISKLTYQLQVSQRDLDKANQEIGLIVKNHNQKSSTTYSEMTGS